MENNIITSVSLQVKQEGKDIKELDLIENFNNKNELLSLANKKNVNDISYPSNWKFHYRDFYNIKPQILVINKIKAIQVKKNQCIL